MQRPRINKRIALSCAAVAAAAGAVIAPLASSALAGDHDLTAAFDKGSDSGYHRSFTFNLNNSGSSAEKDWKLEFNVSQGTPQANSWGVKADQNGRHVTLSNEGNAPVAAKSKLRIDLGNDTPSGGKTKITNCEINSQAFDCDNAPAPPDPDHQPPTVPGNLTGAATDDGSISLDWDDSTDNVGVQNYKIYNNGVLLTETTNSSQIVLGKDVGIKQDTTYNLSVSAKDAAGNESAKSNPVKVHTKKVTPDTQPPTAPSSLTATATSDQAVHLKWGAATDNVGVTEYDVFQKGIDTPVATFAKDKLEGDVTGLKAKTPYEFTVKAKDAAGNTSQASEAVDVTTKGVTPPKPDTVPTNFAVQTYGMADSPQTDFLAMSWTTPKGTDAAHKVLRYEAEITDQDGNKSTTTINYYDPDGLAKSVRPGPANGGDAIADVQVGAHPSSTYIVKLRAQLWDGSWSEYTDAVTVTTPAS
ncbi:fibronectin type III domain-containing protein [Streptomyces sp. AV19]|uniref:fibronectin type III domain-containing protein n=1 Tax=Streptomyces sp. AV19 TaxID=2793068 RepID=UPI0018FEDBB5|nr:fibronectin type III domain-containing protein [Streptomyces sp. AV19]MBH1937180.1 fibronectin type III domain-containing protein [Streptomyces sp. AV19]MDG4536952.1 fibronectin type III domain-containing protein [Streptomyces sp. AV19]